MIKKRGTILLAMALIISCCTGSLAVKAATYDSYFGAVYAITDYESGSRKKQNSGAAYNKYTKSTTKGIKLVSWVEGDDNRNFNCTYKVSYHSYNKYAMDYRVKEGKNCKNHYHHLNISTQAGVIDTAVVSGKWTPN